MKNSQNSKSKMSGQILLLQNDLMSKLSALENPNKQTDELGFEYMGNIQTDSLTNLISKAKYITNENQQKIQKAKKSIKISQKQTNGTFLTGVGVYHLQSANLHTYQPQLDHNHMLKELTSKESGDDLAELRRMIHETGKNLDQYSKDIYETQKQVMNAADRFSSYGNFKINQKKNTINLNKDKKQTRKFSSSSNIKPSRYDFSKV